MVSTDTVNLDLDMAGTGMEEVTDQDMADTVEGMGEATTMRNHNIHKIDFDGKKQNLII